MALGCRMNRKRTYAALIIAMLAGRAANGLAMTRRYRDGWQGLYPAGIPRCRISSPLLPGIIIQLVLIRRL